MVPAPLLYDAVTLRHFAVAGELELCRTLHDHLPLPRWAQAVAGDIDRGAAAGEDGCLAVQGFTWLGVPFADFDLEDVLKIQRLRIGLSGGPSDPSQHAGEAESLHIAEKLDGSIATDDGPAYDFAVRRLGPDRVRDTVDILREAVRCGERTPDEAAAIAALITDSGRHLRRPHSRYPAPDYFA